MNAREQSMLIEWRRTFVGQIVSLQIVNDDGEFVPKIILKFVRVAEQSLFILPEQIFNQRAREFWIVWLQPPINVKPPIAINWNCSFNSIGSAQNNFPARQI